MNESSGAIAFIDTNIWLYAFIKTSDTHRQVRARQVIEQCKPVISPQVINEVCVNLIKKANYTEIQIPRLIESFYAKCQVLPFNRATLLDASNLRRRYSLSFWDSMIVSSAVHSHAIILYSEDMHDGLVVDDQVRIINPFSHGAAP